MDKKYELTNETKELNGRILYRIKALRDFGNIKKGELGGFVEKEDNLSHYCNSWVSGNARVYGDAWVSGNAHVSDNARVYGDAWVSDNARVSSRDDIFVSSYIGSRRDTTTFFKTSDNSIGVRCGCFHGTIDEFKKRVKEVHRREGDSAIYRKEYLAAIKLAKIHLRKDGN